MSAQAIEVVVKNYDRLDSSPSGVQCSFVKINDKWAPNLGRKNGRLICIDFGG